MTQPQTPADWIRIASPELTAAITPFGAELSSLTDAAGRELMTDADPAFWTGRAPLLFPVVGMTHGAQIRLDGHSYPMPKHGFARHSRFTLADHGTDHATFRLTDDADTRAMWPFAFVLDVAFAVTGATLTVTVRIGNPGDDPMPASFGFHPAFAWPLPYGRPRADHRIVFDRPEPGGLRQLTADGLIAPGTRPSPLAGDTLTLADDLFTADALIWDPVESHAIRYGAPDGPHLRVEFPDTDTLGIWTKPGAAYVCIEPWHGIADPAGFTGDFRTKPGVFTIAPGADREIAMRITLEP